MTLPFSCQSSLEWKRGSLAKTQLTSAGTCAVGTVKTGSMPSVALRRFEAEIPEASTVIVPEAENLPETICAISVIMTVRVLVNSDGSQSWLHYRSALCFAQLSRLSRLCGVRILSVGLRPTPRMLENHRKIAQHSGFGAAPQLKIALL